MHLSYFWTQLGSSKGCIWGGKKKLFLISCALRPNIPIVIFVIWTYIILSTPSSFGFLKNMEHIDRPPFGKYLIRARQITGQEQFKVEFSCLSIDSSHRIIGSRHEPYKSSRILHSNPLISASNPELNSSAQEQVEDFDTIPQICIRWLEELRYQIDKSDKPWGLVVSIPGSALSSFRSRATRVIRLLPPPPPQGSICPSFFPFPLVAKRQGGFGRICVVTGKYTTQY